ncbi:hypothetical protein [Streptosporangium vulgare]|uniref:hypothetical protein n=1 Tax=Streptosporangium vulgare TaxID=46190 RepID=UPI0031E30B36
MGATATTGSPAAVARLIEALQQLAPAMPISSLRQHTRAHALREARTCYDHLAGRLGVELMSAMIGNGHLTGGDGTFDLARARQDRPTGYGHDVDYTLTASGEELLAGLGLRLPARRRPVRYCVDWSEQRHHLAGGPRPGPARPVHAGRLDTAHRHHRAVSVTDAGRRGLRDVLGIDLTPP